MLVSNVKLIMKSKGVTIRGLMEQTGLSDKTVLRARSAQIAQCRLYTLETIADALGCSVKDLFEEKK